MSVRPGCFSFVQLSRMASASALIALLAVLAASIVTTGCGARVRPCPITTPVCGFDGYEYSSYCEAYEQGVLVAYPGECSAAPDECKAQCSGDWDPVCWTNSKPAPLTFGSACYAKCTGKKPGSLEKGSCRPSAFCKCTKEYRPVCGVDGKTYGNACAARCAEVPVWYADKCPDLECLKVCKALAEPVCANNGVTYPGACHALCLGYSNYTPGACTREPANCGCIKTPSSSLSAPTRVCGVDGVTYGSACEAACKEADVAYPGPCKTGRHNACSACPQLEGRLCALPSPSNRLKNPTDFYNPCYAACNKVTSLWPYYYAQPCNAACDAKCKGTVTSKPRSSAVCCEDGFEYPSRCYAECLNGNNDGGDGASFDVGRCVPGRCGGAVSGSFGGRCSANGATAKCALPDPCEVMGCAARPDALCVFNGCERWYRAVLITGLCQPYFLDPVSGDLLVSGSGSSTKRCGGLCTKEGQACRLDGKGRPCCPKLTCWGGPVVRDGQVNGTCLSDPLPRG